MQLLVHLFGGKIQEGDVGEYGQNSIYIEKDTPIFKGMGPKETVLLTHRDAAVKTGDDLCVTARSANGIIAAVQHLKLPLWGVQFHPEVELTVNGKTIFNNFLNLCGCKFSYTLKDREQQAIDLIRERTANGEKVLCLLSGGVDSTVCSVLMVKALGPERVICIHIDHGFMRLNESEQVMKTLKSLNLKVKLVDAREEFLQATTEMPAKKGLSSYMTRKLCETVNPEEKRTIIGDTFMRVCNRVIKEMNLDVEHLMLAQGTLRPDLIESGSEHASKTADTIKTHHNDTAVVRHLRNTGRIIEPLCEYHKDEVIQLAKVLGIPESLAARQPFPGPGLAIRILCTDGALSEDEKVVSITSQVKDICAGRAQGMNDCLRGAMNTMHPSMCVLPIKTVGVQGDNRSYSYAAAISLGYFPSEEEWIKLLCIARFVPMRVRELNRVVYLFGERQEESPRSITQTFLVPEVVDKLRIADDIVSRILLDHSLTRKLSQVPVILLPIGFGKSNSYSIVIRTFITNDFMTGVAATPGTDVMPLSVLEQIVTELLKLSFVSRVMFDLTSKPPGTTEWE
ncbi:unnamed protein product [Phytomonas sp. Hart1]|nr:unnamed protein product [Phytomonas sp. Hart1]|eukprot:CCW66285.1 unnamed protein product [Phytomonas sp. isolate Hart1]